MENIKVFFQRALLPKLKFGFTSIIATLVDYCTYLTLVTWYLKPVLSNIISALAGMIINFILQDKFVFQLQRKKINAFWLSLTFSLIGIGISSLLIFLFTRIPFFNQHQFITKAFVIGIIFFYNFYTKRFAFENKKIFDIKTSENETPGNKL